MGVIQATAVANIQPAIRAVAPQRHHTASTRRARDKFFRLPGIHYRRVHRGVTRIKCESLDRLSHFRPAGIRVARPRNLVNLCELCRPRQHSIIAPRRGSRSQDRDALCGNICQDLLRYLYARTEGSSMLSSVAAPEHRILWGLWESL